MKIPKDDREQVVMADIGEEFKTRKPRDNKKKNRASSFKVNVSKKSRKEWGERMNHLRSIT